MQKYLNLINDFYSFVTSAAGFNTFVSAYCLSYLLIYFTMDSKESFLTKQKEALVDSLKWFGTLLLALTVLVGGPFAIFLLGYAVAENVSLIKDLFFNSYFMAPALIAISALISLAFYMARNKKDASLIFLGGEFLIFGMGGVHGAVESNLPHTLGVLTLGVFSIITALSFALIYNNVDEANEKAKLLI